MCGIFGQLGSSIKNVARVKKAIEHRGPDDFGEFYNQSIHLLHARLSIVGLGESGHGPMLSDDKKIALTYNGEIYNYKEIKADLLNLGYHFKSTTDTEVLLIGYQAYGLKILDMIDGIYAFGIWDEVNPDDKKLILVTDPFAVKPLYYGYKNIEGKKNWVFSSEIKSIKASEFFPTFKVNSKALESYLSTGHVQSQMTIFEEIQVLSAGHYLEISLEKGMKKHCFKRFNYKKETSFNLKDHFSKTISSQLMSDVPVGVFLSGGMDSTLVAILASEYLNKNSVNLNKMQAFTIGVDTTKNKKAWDEVPLATTLAENLNIEHHHYYLQKKDFMSSWEDFIKALDHPSIDGFNSYWVSKLAKENNVKVVLSGLGGDEIFAGYPIFKHAYYNNHSSFKGKLLERIPFNFLSKFNLQSQAFNPNDLKHWYQNYRFINKDYNAHFDWQDYDQFPLLSKISLYEKDNYLFPTLLRDMDAVSMYHGIEVRVPMLDWHMWSSILNLDDESKITQIQSHINKPLLFNAFKNFDLFTQVAMQPKKGFELPIGEWAYEIIVEHISMIKEFCHNYNLSEKHFNKALFKYQRNKQNYRVVWSYFIIAQYLNLMLN